MSQKFKVTIEFEADRSISEAPEFTFYVQKVTNITVFNQKGKEVKPSHDFEFQDLIDDLSDDVMDLQIKKYGELD